MDVHPLPSDVLPFVPHRDVMLLLDKLVKVEPDTGIAEVTVRKNNIFYQKKSGLNPIAFIELIAQTAAAHDGYIEMNNNRPLRTGFLVGMKEFIVTGSAVEGDNLCVDVKRIFEINNATVLEGRIRSNDGTTIAAGTVNIWTLDEDPPPAPDVPAAVPIPGEYSEAAAELGQRRCAVGSYILECMRIVKADEEKLTACIAFSPEFIGFQGHFPQAPILPGIVIIQTAIASAELLLKKYLRVKKVDKAKFIDQVLPNQLLKAECIISSGVKGRQSRTQLSVEDKKIAAITFSFEEA